MTRNIGAALAQRGPAVAVVISPHGTVTILEVDRDAVRTAAQQFFRSSQQGSCSMINELNKSRHRKSGDNLNWKLGHEGTPLIGALIVSGSTGVNTAFHPTRSAICAAMRDIPMQRKRGIEGRAANDVRSDSEPVRV